MKLHESIVNLRAEALRSSAITERIVTAKLEDGTPGIADRIDDAMDIADDLADEIDKCLAGIARVRLLACDQVATLLGGRPFIF